MYLTAATLVSLVASLGSASAQSLAQGYAPPASTLTMTKSGVIPVAPTPFPGEETEEGALIYDGKPNPGFTGVNGNASIQTGPASSYLAVLPETNFNPYTGSIITGSAAATSNGTGVTFTLNFTGFPSEVEYGPFVYHIHNLPVPADGNCTATLGHLDPTNRGELYPCDAAHPMTCQAGDLAGKHGNITGTTFTSSFYEPYLSTQPGSDYFFGDKSIVIHTRNATRLTCANFRLVDQSSGSGITNGSTGGTNATNTVAPPPVASSTGGASSTAVAPPSATGAAAGVYKMGGSLLALGVVVAAMVV